MFKLTGKNALVTGATGGIGSEIAKALASQGAKVVLSSTKEEKSGKPYPCVLETHFYKTRIYAHAIFNIYVDRLRRTLASAPTTNPSMVLRISACKKRIIQIASSVAIGPTTNSDAMSPRRPKLLDHCVSI